MTIVNRTNYEFNIGDRVMVIKEFFNYELVPIGSRGVVVSTPWLPGQISRTSHATSNGGGHDIYVRLDNGREVMVRAEGRTTYIKHDLFAVEGPH